MTLLEEMPVQETVDGIVELEAAGLPVGAVVVNLDRPPVLAPARSRTPLPAPSTGPPCAGGPRADVVTARNDPSVDQVVDALLLEAPDHAERVEVAEQERARLAAGHVPMMSLPHIPTGVDLGALYDWPRPAGGRYR